jgi:hypothetical protein
MLSEKEKEAMFSEHLPHRVNLLIAFRECFSGQNPKQNLNPEAFRYFFRCAKDISMLMVRFFCPEVGLTFPRDKKEKEIIEMKTVKGEQYGAEQVLISSIQNDSRFAVLRKVLKAANRAAAHIEPRDVNHDITDKRADRCDQLC